MGWDSCSSDLSKSDTVARLLKEIDRSRYEVLKSKSVSRGLWLVIKEIATGKNLIQLYLIEKHGREYLVKSVSADMGPCELDCPLDWLDVAAQPESEFWVSWAEGVRAFHRRKSKYLMLMIL